MNHVRKHRQQVEANRTPPERAACPVDDTGPPTAGEVIREAMQRVLTTHAATMEGDHERCCVRDCRRERECLAPGGICRARPPVEIANIERRHEWLLELMRKELADMLVARTLGR